MHCYSSCIGCISPQTHFNIVRAESDAYLRKIAAQQEWTDEDPALQLLFLPLTNVPPLPQYAAEPSYLDPFHCRLCLQEVSRYEFANHLTSAHDIFSVQAYRHEVLRRTIADWPQPIPSQILRTRLAAFKEELSD